MTDKVDVADLLLLAHLTGHGERAGIFAPVIVLILVRDTQVQPFS